MSTSHSNTNDFSPKKPNKYIPDSKRKYKVVQDDKDIYTGNYFNYNKVSDIRKDIQVLIGHNCFFFLDNHSIPILKENEDDFILEEICDKDEILQISSELCPPNIKNLLVIAFFAILFIILITMGIYNPDNFVKIYGCVVLLGLSLSKFYFFNKLAVYIIS